MEVIQSNVPAFVDVSNVSQSPVVVAQKQLPATSENNLCPAAIIKFQNCSIEINNNASVEIIKNLMKAIANVK